MMADNIYVLPDTYGPTLRDYYSKLLKEPLPQQLNDLLAMLEEASAQAHVGAPRDAGVRNQPVAQVQAPDKPE